jgi:hypothetical protein
MPVEHENQAETKPPMVLHRSHEGFQTNCSSQLLLLMLLLPASASDSNQVSVAHPYLNKTEDALNKTNEERYWGALKQ